MTGALFIASTMAFMIAATALSMTFDWPDILRQPPDVVLPEFAAGGASLVWTWFVVAWTYAVLAVPILLLPTALARRGDAALRVATYLGPGPLASALYFVNQGDILATAVSGFPVWQLGRTIGSYLWAVWLLVLGVLLLRRVNGGIR